MPTLPLIAGHALGDPIAWRDDQGIPAGALLREARSLAARLPEHRALLNLCEDGYQFAVALAAGLISARPTLLPPSQAPEALRRVHALGTPLACLTDQPAPAIVTRLGCPIITVRADQGASAEDLAAQEVPQIDAAQPAVILFTSGSTGVPVPHTKYFGQLVEAAQATQSRLPQATDGRGYTLLGTVPAQHMFGLEATVLLALQTPSALRAERPFFPADIAATLARMPRPRALVSTPVHLRALLDAGVMLPPLDLVMCATAWLPESLAREVEARFAGPLIEIYGSTETGMLASRRTALERGWQLFPGVRLQREQGRWHARGGHVPVAMPLSDELEPLDEEHFLLHGRSTDLVKVAGKRSSLAHLSQQLLSIPGVRDGAFFLHELTHGSISGVTRLAAVVVAPGLSQGEITAALRERVDAVFLPRPLWLVDQLPRNASGKLPREALRTLAVQLASQRARTRS